MAFLIKNVTPANRSGAAIGSVTASVPEPSSYRWSKKDLSGPDAGRSVSMDMVKLMRGKARTLDLEWKGLGFSQVSSLLNAFDHEYILLTYYDALTGNDQTKHFYMGDMTVDVYSTLGGGLTRTVSFNCIQSKVDKFSPT